ncbi:type II toxin-antitoxin system Phd/YefM family antitoxin [Candidatus Binatia bacterium]|nr:type II toxin-antitoxin system Phd/YefM family antitoxin [Candidatus Binatia bacterium]
MDVNVYAAKTQLSRLLERVSHGEEVVITRHGKPVAKLVPITRRQAPRKLGTLRGKIRIAKNFDAPLPDDLLDAFEGKA